MTFAERVPAVWLRQRRLRRSVVGMLTWTFLAHRLSEAMEGPQSGNGESGRNVRKWAKPAKTIVAKVRQFSLSYTRPWCHARSSALSNRRSRPWCKADHALRAAWLFAGSTNDRALA